MSRPLLSRGTLPRGPRPVGPFPGVRRRLRGCGSEDVSVPATDPLAERRRAAELARPAPASRRVLLRYADGRDRPDPRGPRDVGPHDRRPSGAGSPSHGTRVPPLGPRFAPAPGGLAPAPPSLPLLPGRGRRRGELARGPGRHPAPLRPRDRAGHRHGPRLLHRARRPPRSASRSPPPRTGPRSSACSSTRPSCPAPTCPASHRRSRSPCRSSRTPGAGGCAATTRAATSPRRSPHSSHGTWCDVHRQVLRRPDRGRTTSSCWTRPNAPG